MSNPNKEVLEYRGQCTAEYYNQFFNPNICHVCKSVDKGNLILCGQCCLISYCSKEHKTLHQLEHAGICTIIAEILKVKPHTDTRRYSDWEEWIQSRKEFMELIQQKFYQPLKPYMQQMILWSKSCVVCHQQAGLRVCERCFSVNYCNEHAEVFDRRHNEVKCDQLMLLLNIDIETIYGKITNTSYEFLPLIHINMHVEEMLEFCMEYMLMQRTNLDWIAQDYVISDYLSDPLTVYFGLKRVNLLHLLQQNDVIIHIITSNTVETDGLLVWEILLHLLSEVRNLTIIVIGPELKYNSGTPKLCFCCLYKKKSFTFFLFPMLYHDYLKSHGIHSIPHISVGFNVEFNKGVTWFKSIKAIQFFCKPLILTYPFRKRARPNIINIQDALNNNVLPILSNRNHFSGLAPHRDLETGDTYFRNEYLIIYQSLFI